MKETVKVAIGGYAFTCDADAYQVLERYLNNLKEHLKGKADANEIINDIEGRMSELLSLKADSPACIINMEDARDIIGIMGNPSDIVDEEDIDNKAKSTPHKKPFAPTSKKLFRDTDHAVLGGVFSGLGHYFRVDPVILRIVYLVILIAWWKIFNQYGGLLVLSYFILWAVVPKAKTFEQKLTMSGKDSSVQNIVSGNAAQGGMRGSGLGQALKKILKVLFMVILVCIAVFGLITAFSAFVLPVFFNIPSAKDVMEAVGWYSPSAVIALTAMWLIPVFMIIYFIVRLMNRIVPRDLAVLGVAFLAFICAGLYLSAISINFAKDYRHMESYTEKFSPQLNSDTLQIKLAPLYHNSDNIFDSNEIYQIDDNKNISWFVMPRINIRRDTAYKQIEIEIKKHAFAGNKQKAFDKAKESRLNIAENNGGITINPHVYSKDNLWDREIFSITIFCPEDKTIIVDKLLESKTRGEKNPSVKEITTESNELRIDSQTVENKDSVSVNDSVVISVKEQIL